MEPSEEFATGVAPRAVLREAGVTARASTDRLWLIPILRCEVRFIPVEIVSQHITEKKETHFFAITQFYVRMTFQDLVKPGRAAS